MAAALISSGALSCASQVAPIDSGIDTPSVDHGTIANIAIPDAIACVPMADAAVRSYPDCGVWLPTGNALAMTCVHTNPPPMTGGPIADGVYVLVADQSYVGPTGTCDSSGCNRWLAETVAFRGSMVLDSARFRSDAVTILTLPVTGTYSIAGNSITYTYTCGNRGSSTLTFSADSSGVVLCGGDQCFFFVRQ